MKREIKIGTTDYTALILVRDTAGAAKTGLTNASAGLDVSYIRVETDNDVTVTAGAPVALATPALTDPHLDWGFLEVDAINHPGIYRLDIADGVFASGAWASVVTLIGTGLDPTHIEFVLIAVDKLDTVRMGLTALPNAAADGVGGLPISDAGGLDLDTKLANTNEITSARMGTLTDWINGGRLDLLVDAVKTVTDALTSAAATKLAASAGTIVLGTAQTGTLSTTQMTTDLSLSVNDQMNGRIIIFKTDTTTAALRNQATDITDSATTGGLLTFTALTTAPVNGDAFIIV